jgi:hypothetical protein
VHADGAPSLPDLYFHALTGGAGNLDDHLANGT